MILGTVRGKIIANSALILLILSLTTLYSGFASLELTRSVDLLFRTNRAMESLRGLLGSTEAGLEGYLTTKSSDSLKDYIRYSTKLSDQARGPQSRYRAGRRPASPARPVGPYRQLSRGHRGERGGQARPGRRGLHRALRELRAQRRARPLPHREDRRHLPLGLARRPTRGFSAQIPAVILSNAALVVAASLLGLMLLVSYSYKLTDPISRLAEAARAVGRGDYGYRAARSRVAADEIGTMTAAFASMQESVRLSFEELKSKAEVEKRLMEERMRVLELDHKLKDAELLALQTQINPHFLFNTLSAGMQLALAEDADRTADFLDNLAAFIRYVLKPPARSVRVSDEIECVERYIWLLRLRFGDRYRFTLSVDEEALGVETPALLLQPLVENAVAHGLRDREEGGRDPGEREPRGRVRPASRRGYGGGHEPR